MTKYLLSQEDSGVFFLSERVSQDPLKTFLEDSVHAVEETTILHCSSVFTTRLPYDFNLPTLSILFEGIADVRDC